MCVCVCAFVFLDCFLSARQIAAHSENKPRKQTHTHIDRTAIFRPGHPRNTEVVSDAKLRPGHGDDFAANRNQSDHLRHHERHYTTSRLEPISLHTLIDFVETCKKSTGRAYLFSIRKHESRCFMFITASTHLLSVGVQTLYSSDKVRYPPLF